METKENILSEERTPSANANDEEIYTYLYSHLDEEAIKNATVEIELGKTPWTFSDVF